MYMMNTHIIGLVADHQIKWFPPVNSSRHLRTKREHVWLTLFMHAVLVNMRTNGQLSPHAVVFSRQMLN